MSRKHNDARHRGNIYLSNHLESISRYIYCIVFYIHVHFVCGLIGNDN